MSVKVTQVEFKRLARLAAPILRQAPELGLDPYALLYMLGGLESSWGTNNVPRFERSYARGGRYFSPDLDRLHGDHAAMSYGPLQIMFRNAVDTLPGITPERLMEPVTSVVVATEFLNGAVLRRFSASTPEAVLDAWNTGNPNDRILPADAYLKRGVQYYRRALEGND